MRLRALSPVTRSAADGPALAEDLRARDEQTVALLWDELARTDPVLFSILWRKAHRAAPDRGLPAQPDAPPLEDALTAPQSS